MTDRSIIEGGCLCGDIRYRIDGAAPPGAHCHCSICRRASGAPVVTWITVARNTFTITKGQPRHYPSSTHGERGFCRRCGSQLTFATSRSPALIDITVAGLDRSRDFPPDHHVYWPDRLPWLHVDEHLPHYDADTPAGVLAAAGLPAGSIIDPKGSIIDSESGD